VGDRYYGLNFATIDFDWTNLNDPVMKVDIRNLEGESVKHLDLKLSEIS
jgi:hypothetical protein